jgi:hypothetical protein
MGMSNKNVYKMSVKSSKYNVIFFRTEIWTSEEKIRGQAADIEDVDMEENGEVKMNREEN